jgi:hypothetical protein
VRTGASRLAGSHPISTRALPRLLLGQRRLPDQQTGHLERKEHGDDQQQRADRQRADAVPHARIRLNADLLASAITIAPIDDLAVVDVDRLTLAVRANVFDECRKFVCAHHREDVCYFVIFVFHIEKRKTYNHIEYKYLILYSKIELRH